MAQTLFLPKKIYFKTGCTPVALRELSEVYGCRRALLVTDAKLYRNGTASQVIDLLRKKGIRTAEIFTISDPVKLSELHAAVPKLNEFAPDAILGVGGGNALSAAKLLGALYENPELDLTDETALPAYTKAGLALLAADLSSGGQSSMLAEFEDDAGERHTVCSRNLLPEISVTDADYTKYLTPDELRAEAAKTLERAKAVRSRETGSEFTDGMLTEAIALVEKYTDYAAQGCPKAREHLANAANLAAIADGNVPKA